MTMDCQDEERLVEQIRQRNPKALADYIEKNRVPLIGFIRTITGNRLLSIVELDDLMQEVSATAIQSLSTAPFEEYQPMQWLQQIARRRVVDAHRFHFDAQRRDAGRQQSIHGAGNAGSEEVGLEQLLAASMTSPSAAFSRDIRASRLQEAIEQLPDEQKTVVRMRYVEGLPTKQIAEKLGKNDVAIRVLLSRCMRILENQLKDVKPSR